MAKILIVDDEVDIADLLKDLVTDWGHEALVVNNGRAALEVMVKEKPHVVFLDRRMPGLKGKDVLKQMKEKGIQAHVIVMTADVDDQAHEEMKSLGADGIITKPFEILKLQDQLKKILPLIFSN